MQGKSFRKRHVLEIDRLTQVETLTGGVLRGRKGGDYCRSIRLPAKGRVRHCTFPIATWFHVGALRP